MPLTQPPRIDLDLKPLRRAKREARERLHKEARLNALMELYHRSADFVALENLDTKIEAFLASPGHKYISTMQDLLSRYYDENNAVDDIRGKERVAELARVLDGTSIDGKLGIEGILAWKASQKTTTPEPTTVEPTIAADAVNTSPAPAATST
jgi:hypothetical protein